MEFKLESTPDMRERRINTFLSVANKSLYNMYNMVLVELTKFKIKF